MQVFPDVPPAWRNDVLAERWTGVRRLRRVVTGALEVERREKRIGSSLQAAPTVYADEATIAACQGLDVAELCITSGLTLEVGDGPSNAYRLDEVPGIAVVPTGADGGKCERCWKVLPEVAGGADLCNRCADAVAHYEEHAA